MFIWYWVSLMSNKGRTITNTPFFMEHRNSPSASCLMLPFDGWDCE